MRKKARMADARLPRPGPFRVQTRCEGDALLIQASGELDVATVGPLTEELGAAEAQGTKRIVLDLSRLEFIDVSGVAAVVAAKRSAKLNRHNFELVGATRDVARVVELCGLQSW